MTQNNQRLDKYKGLNFEARQAAINEKLHKTTEEMNASLRNRQLDNHTVKHSKMAHETNSAYLNRRSAVISSNNNSEGGVYIGDFGTAYDNNGPQATTSTQSSHMSTPEPSNQASHSKQSSLNKSLSATEHYSSGCQSTPKTPASSSLSQSRESSYSEFARFIGNLKTDSDIATSNSSDMATHTTNIGVLNISGLQCTPRTPYPSIEETCGPCRAMNNAQYPDSQQRAPSINYTDSLDIGRLSINDYTAEDDEMASSSNNGLRSSSSMDSFSSTDSLDRDFDCDSTPFTDPESDINTDSGYFDSFQQHKSEHNSSDHFNNDFDDMEEDLLIPEINEIASARTSTSNHTYKLPKIKFMCGHLYDYEHNTHPEDDENPLLLNLLLPTPKQRLAEIRRRRAERQNPTPTILEFCSAGCVKMFLDWEDDDNNRDRILRESVAIRYSNFWGVDGDIRGHNNCKNDIRDIKTRLIRPSGSQHVDAKLIVDAATAVDVETAWPHHRGSNSDGGDYGHGSYERRIFTEEDEKGLGRWILEGNADPKQ